MPLQPVAWEQLVQVQQQQLFERDIAELIGLGGQARETRDLRGNRQQGVQDFAVAAAFQLQCQREACVRDEREGVRGVNRQGGQNREDLIEENIRQIVFVLFGQRGAVVDGQIVFFHLGPQVSPRALLAVHKVAGVRIDQF